MSRRTSDAAPDVAPGTAGPSGSTTPSRLSRVADACALITFAIGLLVVAGWLMDIDVLKRVLPGMVAMKFNTAVGFGLAGAALWWRTRPAPRIALGALVALLGALSLGEYLAGLDFGIDQFFIGEIAASQEVAYLPGRMAPTTALCFLLLGLAALGSGTTVRQPGPGQRRLDDVSGRLGLASEMLALVACVIGGFSLVAYPTGALYLRQLPGSVSMALHTAAAFVVLGTGTLCAAEGVVAQTLRLRGTGRVLWIGCAVLTCLLVAVGIVCAVNIQTLAQEAGAQADVASPLFLLVGSVLLALVTSGAVARAVSKQEQLVREQREWLRVTLSSIGDGVIACDTQRRVTFVNPVAEALTGWQAGEAQGQPLATVLRLVNERTGEPAADIAEQVLREGRVVELANHTVLVTRDGRQVFIEDSAAPIADDTGALTGVVFVFHDVTQRRHATDQLKESEARLSRAQEMAHLGSWELDLLKNQLTWSDEVYRIFGLEPQQFAATYEAFLAAVHPDDRAAVDAAYAGSVRDGRDSYEIEHRVVRRASGDIRTVHEKCLHVRDAEGRIIRSLGMVHDITERKKAEEALAAANLHLAESDQRKNEFLAVLSHELRNPLTPIRNGLYLLERAIPGSEQAKRAREVIDRQTRQLARLVDDLLEVTRITRNKIRLQRGPLELNDLVRRSVEDYQSLFDERGIVLEATFAAEPLPINGDAARLSQVVGNLLQNAAKFTPSGGRVVVSTSAAGSSERARLSVSDTGVGIQPAMLRRLFQPFMQADATLDRTRGGLGLGLALVKGLVEMHGGEVRAHSDGCDKGAEFVVELPIERTAAAQVKPETAAAASRLRVLIIEDNIDAADSLCDALQLGGYDVEVAYSGAEGLAAARGFRPEVVLCDIGLPGMNGYDVARTFRADDELKGACLVALSGYALPEDVQRASDAGFESHLAKPPSMEKVQALLSEVAQRAADARVDAPLSKT
jgi:PAS domain S-box-containing protein